MVARAIWLLAHCRTTAHPPAGNARLREAFRGCAMVVVNECVNRRCRQQGLDLTPSAQALP